MMSTVLTTEPDVAAAMREIGARARAAARVVANAPAEQKTRALDCHRAPVAGALASHPYR